MRNSRFSSISKVLLFVSILQTNSLISEGAAAQVNELCSSLNETACYDIFEPYMCILNGTQKWFAASNKCTAMKNMMKWICEEEIENADIEQVVCYRGVEEKQAEMNEFK